MKFFRVAPKWGSSFARKASCPPTIARCPPIPLTASGRVAQQSCGCQGCLRAMQSICVALLNRSADGVRPLHAIRSVRAELPHWYMRNSRIVRPHCRHSSAPAMSFLGRRAQASIGRPAMVDPMIWSPIRIEVVPGLISAGHAIETSSGQRTKIPRVRLSPGSGSLDQGAPRLDIAGLCDPATLHRATTRVFGRNQTKIGHHCRGFPNREKSPTSATIVTALIKAAPRIAWIAAAIGAIDQSGRCSVICRVNRDRGLQSAVQGNLRNTESICRSYETELLSISISYGDISKFPYVAIHHQGELS